MPNSGAKTFLLVLLIFFSTSLLGWQYLNHRPSSMDETRHMKLAMDYRAWMVKAVPLTDEWSHVYPPLYHLSIIPALSIGRPSEAKATATHFIYFAIFVAGCLLLGRSHQRPDWESVLAAFLCLGYCWVLWASRRALIDFPLMAWVTFSMAMLARTDGFSSTESSLLLGVVLGIGLLLKPPFILFMAGPVLWVLVTGQHGARLKNRCAAVALAAAIAVPWYFWQSAYFLSKASRLAAESQGPGMDPHTLEGWLYYLRLLRFQMGTASLVFTALGIVLALLRPPRRGSGFLLAWFLSGYVFLSLLVNKDPRHSLALLPPLAILAARGWGHFAQDLGSPFLIGWAGPLLLAYNVWTFDRPKTEDWMHGPILAMLAERHDSSQPFMLASVLSHHPYFFARTLKWSAMQAGVGLDMSSPGDSNTSFTEFIIRRVGDQGTETGELDRQWQSLKPASRAFTSLFALQRKFILPDRSEVDIYQRLSHPQFNVQPLSTKEVERRLARVLGQWIQGTLIVAVEAKPETLREGRLERVRISCSPCSAQGVRIQKADLVVEKPWINLYRLWDENRLGLLAFESIKPRIELLDSDVSSGLKSVKEMQDAKVHFRGERVQVQGHFRRIPVTATASVELDSVLFPHLDAVLDGVTFWKIPLPGWILGKAHRQSLWLYPIPSFPGRIDVGQITIENGRLQIT